jgi:hypothetical protein
MNKTKKYTKKNNKFTAKNRKKLTNYILLPDLTPRRINEVSEIINNDSPKNLPVLSNSVLINGSYSPSINKELVVLQSIPRENVLDCNNLKAFQLQEPLLIGIKGKLFGKTCIPYYEPEAIKFLLKNLSANKHVIIEKIVPPIQSQSNCWFNTMFVSLFVSDKGRKFFHFFRQLMIEGKQSNGSQIPPNLWNAFALFNYSIDACLTGNKFAYVLDTNSIIRNIYEVIPKSYKDKFPFIRNIDEAGNPIRYFFSLIYYLNSKSLQVSFIQNTNANWKDKILKNIQKETHLPHIIILEIMDKEDFSSGNSGLTTNKPKSFFIKGAKYSLDSCIIRDTTQQHFCSTLTCDNKEMAYDGMSFSRLVPLEWKKYINSNFNWSFEGSNNSDGSPLKWNFTHGYQMLIYYRVK